MSMQKDKGRAHEKSVAALLSKWSGRLWCRTPASGALRWANSIWTFGDICPPENMPLVVECKHHAKISIPGLLSGRNQIIDWYEQSREDSKRASTALGIDNIPFIVVFRENGVADRMAVDSKLFRRLVIPCTGVRHFRVGAMEHDMTICLFQQFLDATRPSFFTVEQKAA